MEDQIKRKRGRPKKRIFGVPFKKKLVNVQESTGNLIDGEIKRKRGRPKKIIFGVPFKKKLVNVQESTGSLIDGEIKRKRGRPKKRIFGVPFKKKLVNVQESTGSLIDGEIKRKRGRPKKRIVGVPFKKKLVNVQESSRNFVDGAHEMKRKRGRPKKRIFGIPFKKKLVQESSARTMSTKKIKMADRLKGTEKNVWVEFGQLSAQYKALNLGQGFPDYHPPKHVMEKFTNVIQGDNPLSHQYTRSYGNPHLVNTLSKLYSPIMKRQIDPMSECFVSVGAFGVLFSTIQGLINPGDEVIIIEPFFDCYEPMVRVAGGVPVFIPLCATKKEGAMTSHDWKLDEKELASKFTNKTKAIMLNNPNNPVGKVYKEDELQMIADLCIKHDVLVIADEVYEWMIYKGHQHIKIATLPGMWERTITIGSAGKTFSATGWKLGWGIGPADLIQALHVLHQNSIYTCPTPIQETVANGLDYELSVFDDENECYLKSLALELQPKRDALGEILTELGMNPTIPEGGYFMMADISSLNLDIPDDGTDDPFDFKFVRWMTKEKRLSAIPPSAFYNKEHKNLGEKYIRFCFIKEDNTLDAAAKILKDWKSELKASK